MGIKLKQKSFTSFAGLFVADQTWLDFIFLVANDSVAFYGMPTQPLWRHCLLRRQ